MESHFYEPKNKRFNTDCFTARNKSLKWLRKFQKSSDILEKKKYINATKKYKAVRNRARLKYLQDLNVKINQVHSIKDWWKIANKIRNKTFQENSDISATTFKIYFIKLLNPPHISAEVLYAEGLDSQITIEDVEAVLNKTKNK